MVKMGAIMPFMKVKGMSNWEAFSFLFLVGGYFFIGMNLYEPLWARWKINDILETTMQDKEVMSQSSKEIAGSILKRLSINGVYGITVKDFKIQKTDKKVRVTFKKALPATMPFDIDINVNINTKIEVDRPS